MLAITRSVTNNTNKLPRSLFYSVILFSSLVVTACGGGGGGGGDSASGGNTTPTNPAVTGSSTINIGSTPANVNSGDTEFVVSGLASAGIYSVWVHDVSSDIALATYIDPSYPITTCSSDVNGIATEECSTVSSVDGKIYLKVSASENTNYTITVKPSPENEGTVAEPVSLTLNTSYNGQVSIGNSYYKLSGLTPGLVYNISMTNILQDADLSVSMLKDFSTMCESINAGEQAESCLMPANFEGDLYIKTDSSGFGAYYSLNVVATTQTENIFEGYVDAPIDLTGMLPHAGQVNRADSYYKFTGLTPGVRYEVRILNTTVDTQIYFYDTAELVNVDCSLNYHPSLPAKRLCVATAPASGTLYLAIPYWGTPGGTYTVDLGLAPEAEGTSDTPVEITADAMPYYGQVDTTASYYVITGLTPDYVYQVQFNDVTHHYARMSAGDSPSTLNLGCTNCTIRSSSTGEIYIVIDGSSTDNENNDLGAWFTFNFGETENAEGSVSSPVLIPGDGTVYNGQVDDTSSYYMVTGLVPGQYYQIYRTTDEYDKPSFTSTTDSTYTTSNCKTFPGMCLAAADASGNLYIRVSFHKIPGISFKLWIQPSLLDSEGTAAAPLDITGGLAGGTPTVHNGQVIAHYNEEISYYVLSGLPGSTNYSITATNLTDDIKLDVYSDAAMSNRLCSTDLTGITDETCNVVSGPAGGAIKDVSLYIKVTLDKYGTTHNWDGANYTLTASPGGTPLTSEGAVGSPVDITGLTPYAGSVSYNEASYYVINGLDPASFYAMMLNHDKTRLVLSLWTDSTYSTNACNAGISYFTDHIVCAPNASGQFFVRVDDSSFNTAYTLDLKPVPVNEGSDVMPLDITASLPYSGQAILGAGTKSYYTVSGLLADTDYVVITSNSTQNANTSVYDNVDFSTGFQCSDYGVQPSDTCIATSSPTGELFIAVDGNNASGTFFDLDVKVAPVAEGSAASPVEVPYQSAFQGKTEWSGSYYKATGLVPYSTHRVSLIEQDTDYIVKIYTDSTYQHVLCSNSFDDYDTGCGASANGNGEIYFTVTQNRGYYKIFIP